VHVSTPNIVRLLTDNQAKEIFLASGTLEELAQRYGVEITAIRHIKMRRTWRHATKDLEKAPQNRVGRPRLNPEIAKTIQQTKGTYGQLAKKYKLSTNTIQQIKNGEWFGQKVIKIRFSGPK